MSDYEDMSVEELREEYKRIVSEQADRGARRLSFTMDGMVEAGDVKRELKDRDAWDGDWR